MFAFKICLLFKNIYQFKNKKNSPHDGEASECKIYLEILIYNQHLLKLIKQKKIMVFLCGGCYAFISGDLTCMLGKLGKFPSCDFIEYLLI